MENSETQITLLSTSYRTKIKKKRNSAQKTKKIKFSKYASIL
jgi:hypothetical protein